MKATNIMFFAAALLLSTVVLSLNPDVQTAYAYPPGVGILSKAKNCLTCHANNGPWTDAEKTIIDIIEKDSRKSFRQPDGNFLLQVKRHELLTVRTVIGYKKNDTNVAPYRNGWIYIDPTTIESSSLSKFAPGWDVNLQASCRLVGDNLEGFEGFDLSVLPITVRPLDAARDGQIILQGMLTRGESVKGKGKEGMVGNYFERTVRLKVLD
ncbi:MAG: hypothetical protein AABZ41_06565 [Bacteroidota bacterium]